MAPGFPAAMNFSREYLINHVNDSCQEPNKHSRSYREGEFVFLCIRTGCFPQLNPSGAGFMAIFLFVDFLLHEYPSNCGFFIYSIIPHRVQ